MVKIEVRGNRMDVKIKNGILLEDYPGLDDFLVQFITREAHKLEWYQVTKDVNTSSTTPFSIEARYENEFLSNTVAKAIELWLGTRDVDCELET